MSGPFTQRDPIGLAGGVNQYGYVGGDPVNNSDPFGLCAAASGADTTAALDCTYSQSSGALSCKDAKGDEVVSETGYSGRGPHKNNSASEAIRNWGPIPRGTYSIGATTTTRGPFTIVLTPTSSTDTFGRSAFRIHGDSRRNPGTASEGCVIVGRSSRERSSNSRGSTLRVVQ